MRLSVRTHKLAIYGASAGCLVMAAGVVSWAIRANGLPTEVRSDVSSESPVVSASFATTPLKNDFAQLCDVRLRRPLYDPPPPKPEVRQLPPLNIQLLGTILEGENSIAMIRSEQGKTEYRRRGESVGPADGAATIVEIQGDAIVLDRQSERVTLRVMSGDRR